MRQSKIIKTSVWVATNIKQKVWQNLQKMSLDIFSNQILLESIDYS